MRLNLASKVPQTYSPEVIRSLFREIEQMVNLMATGSIQVRGAMAAAPTTGTWARGDFIWNSAPTSGGSAGFICVLGGTPGTWKNWGAIS